MGWDGMEWNKMEFQLVQRLQGGLETSYESGSV